MELSEANQDFRCLKLCEFHLLLIASQGIKARLFRGIFGEGECKQPGSQDDLAQHSQTPG